MAAPQRVGGETVAEAMGRRGARGYPGSVPDIRDARCFPSRDRRSENLWDGATCAAETVDQPQDAAVRMKYLLGHELTHWVQANWLQEAGRVFGDGAFYIANVNLIASSACAKEPPPLTGSVLHHLRSVEYAQGGFNEGFAQFVSTAIYNDLDDGAGMQNDAARFRYYKLLQGSPQYQDLIDGGYRVALVDDGTDPLPGGDLRWLETQCSADVGTAGAEKGVEMDWMRFWWDFMTADDLPGTKPTMAQLMAFVSLVRDERGVDPNDKDKPLPTTWSQTQAWAGFKLAFSATNFEAVTGMTTSEHLQRLVDAGCRNGVTSGIEECAP